MTDTRDPIRTETRYEPQAPLSVAARSACPRCGRGHLFKGFLSIAPRCDACGLDFSFADPADGPAFFVMSFVGIVVVGIALWLEIAYEPPFWVHALVGGGLSIGLSLALVRPLKGMLAALQFHNKAEQGRFR